MSDDELLEVLIGRIRCLETQASIKKKSPESTRGRYQPIRWMRTHWRDDPFSRGVYSHVSTGLTSETSRRVWEELGRAETDYLYFAGEATMTSSLIRSTVHGAWLSGVRAAEEVTRSLSQPISTPGYREFLERMS
jgi:monoamine oxidase